MLDVHDPSDRELDAREANERASERSGGLATLESLLGDIVRQPPRRYYTEQEILRLNAPSPKEARLARRDRLERSGALPVLTERGLAAIVNDSPVATPSLEWVRRWLSGVDDVGRKSVIGLFGPTDGGKTVAAAWALARHDGVYIESNALCVHRGTLYRPPDATYSKCLTASLLVIDELGSEDDAGVAAATVREVINRRMRGKRTLLLGNLTEADWVRLCDARTRSRFEEVGEVFAAPHVGLRRSHG